MSRGKPPSGTELNNHFLSRWSRLKSEAREKPATPAEETTADRLPPSQAPADLVSASNVVPAQAPAPLPPVESLTPDSDFSPFMGAGVDERLKQLALKRLFEDPRFNVMDGLDVYIDDYSKPDPLPEGWLEKLNQVARLGEYREPEAAPESAEKPDGEEGQSSQLADTGDAGPAPPEVPES